jgi:hypothetical protein
LFKDKLIIKLLKKSLGKMSLVAQYAINAVQYAVGRGLINGKTESTLNPLDYATRAEAAAILCRFTENNF